MNLNITVNESASSATTTPGTFNVRAYYTQTDAGHLFGPFATREQAEACMIVLAARSDVINAVIEGDTV